MDGKPKMTLRELELENLKKEATPKCKHCLGKGHNGYNLKTDRYYLCRCVKHNRLAAKAEEAEASNDQEPETFNGFNSIQVATIRRKRDEIELLEERASQADKKSAEHPLQERLAEARAAVEEEQKGISAKANTAREQREMIAKESAMVARCDELIAGYKKEKAQRQARMAEMDKEASRLERESAKAEAVSRSEGPQRALSQLEKRLHRETHTFQKKGREALKKAQRIRQHLDATYPGHEQVP